MNIIDQNHSDSLATASKVLLEGGIVILPTDTVYGIGCLLNEKAIKKLYQIKNRPLSQPTAILMSKKVFYQKLKHEKENIDEIIGEYPAGRITLVFKANSLHLKFPKVLLKNDKIGIRLPKFRFLEKLIDLTGPIVASSANKKGESVPENYQEIDLDIINQADLVIKTNQKSSGIPSTVYDIEQEKIIRA